MFESPLCRKKLPGMGPVSCFCFALELKAFDSHMSKADTFSPLCVLFQAETFGNELEASVVYFLILSLNTVTPM
jgi:hypothetical protein